MCGIVGYWDRDGTEIAIIQRMADQISHRGPDDYGTWITDEGDLALAHRRLSIIDLSPAGHQPMLSPCGRYTLIYNGEIYNHHEIRKELEQVGGGVHWRGHSDTEVLLIALRHWGVEATLKRLNGMFSFALWDNSERTLYLARDRMGEKPLYYGNNNGRFLFGSELKSLTAHPDWRGEVDRNALTLYLRHNYISAPWSIYQDIHKLPPAHYVVIKEAGAKTAQPQCYWNLKEIAEAGPVNPPSTPNQYLDDLEVLLRDAVKRRMMADVPLGAFLSGGIDSSLVVSLMQAQSTQPVKTFTIGFHEEGYNEATHAKAVADHLGTDHTELYISPKEAMEVIPDIPTIWDEPFSDSSQIPTLLVSSLARQHVAVSLSGDGGDELFYGYSRYNQCNKLWKILRWLPIPARRLLAHLMRAIPGAPLEQLLRYLPKRFQIPHLADRLPKIADLMGAPTPELIYQQLVSHWKRPANIVLGGNEPSTLFSSPERLPKLPTLSEKMSYIDMQTYLPDDILTKVDRASMAVSLEARVPLLDHRLVEFACRLPQSIKTYDGQGKWPLRSLLNRYVPTTLTHRPKMGFGVPIEHWLRGPLRDWAEALLDENRLRNEGFFNPEPIRTMWHEHLSGEARRHYYLWDILMFQAWLDHNR